MTAVLAGDYTLSIHPRDMETEICTNTRTHVFTAALFVTPPHVLGQGSGYTGCGPSTPQGPSAKQPAVDTATAWKGLQLSAQASLKGSQTTCCRLYDEMEKGRTDSGLQRRGEGECRQEGGAPVALTRCAGPDCVSAGALVTGLCLQFSKMSP